MQPKILDSRRNTLVFHNLRSYDAHLFIMKLGKKFSRDDNAVIAENKKKYVSFNLNIEGVTDNEGKDVRKNIVADTHRHESPTRREQNLNLSRT